MNKFARVKDGYIYAINTNIDVNYIPEDAVEVDFDDELIDEINADINYAMHKIDGTIDQERLKKYEELKTKEAVVITTDIDPNQMLLAMSRISLGKSTKSDTQLVEKVKVVENHKARIDVINEEMKIEYKYEEIKEIEGE